MIEGKWGTTINPSRISVSEHTKRHEDTNDFIEYEDDDEEPRLIQEIDESVDAQGKAIDVNPPYDKIIQAEVQLQHENLVQPQAV